MDVDGLQAAVAVGMYQDDGGHEQVGAAAQAHEGLEGTRLIARFVQHLGGVLRDDGELVCAEDPLPRMLGGERTGLTPSERTGEFADSERFELIVERALVKIWRRGVKRDLQASQELRSVRGRGREDELWWSLST